MCPPMGDAVWQIVEDSIRLEKDVAAPQSRLEKDVAAPQSQQPTSAPRLRPVTNFTDVPELQLPPPLELDSDLYDDYGFLLPTTPPASPRLGPQPWPLQYEDIPDLWLPQSNSKHIEFSDTSDDGVSSSDDAENCEAGSILEPGVWRAREHRVELVDGTSFMLDICLGTVACHLMDADNASQISTSATSSSILSTMIRG
eukprot:TRINITY_DN11552_c0_g1_i1.p1 TRINITY_DN11552_c0_g1~~TRINITY_DN11552_c0_g1_i1.p1  ORF type:complete len:199 (-),score=31.85 TRINITY_DN11552_c0_g1_i1:717-1313(-)